MKQNCGKEYLQDTFSSLWGYRVLQCQHSNAEVQEYHASRKNKVSLSTAKVCGLHRHAEAALRAGITKLGLFALGPNLSGTHMLACTTMLIIDIIINVVLS